MTPEFTICVLLYGDHLDLAKRCLEPILQLPRNRIDLRIGCNAIGRDTNEWLRDTFNIEGDDEHVARMYRSATNTGKYPMMRRMFHDTMYAIRSPYIMWADDDSVLTTPTNEWLDKAKEAILPTDMCGCVMGTAYAGNQTQWIQMQSWYKGKSFFQQLLATGGKYLMPWFAVGGWWIVKTRVVMQLDWPPKNIIHRGGDVMLGEALYQNDLKLVNFYDGVTINADKDGKAHKSPRRGMDTLPVGVDYEPPLTVALHTATKDIDPKLLDYPGL